MIVGLKTEERDKIVSLLTADWHMRMTAANKIAWGAPLGAVDRNRHDALLEQVHFDKALIQKLESEGIDTE